MADTFEAIIDGIIAIEGGHSLDPADPGGETIWGITSAVAKANGYKAPMKSMSRETAKDIYRAIYWNASGFYMINTVSRAIAGELLDTGINMGVSTATKFLQRCLNAFNAAGTLYKDVTPDGDCGGKTLAACRSFLAIRGAEGEGVLLEAMNCLQGARYIELAEGNPASERFAYGWVKNRVKL